MFNERFLECIKTGRKVKQNTAEERNSMIMEREKDTMVSDNIINTQPDTITYSKIQTDIEEDQSNKGALKKSMIQQILLQSYAYTRKRSRSLSESTSERDLMNDAKDTDISKQTIYKQKHI